MTMRLTDAGTGVSDLESDGETFYGVVPSDAGPAAHDPEWATDDPLQSRGGRLLEAVVVRQRDFERKLYRKRLKIKVRFVELTDTIPVQGPEAEVVGGTVTAGFLSLLKPREREIVVLLNSGVTNLTELGDLMGYANHSAVSKHLARVRTAAIRHFDAI
jgi:hypothetical protein